MLRENICIQQKLIKQTKTYHKGKSNSVQESGGEAPGKFLRIRPLLSPRMHLTTNFYRYGEGEGEVKAKLRFSAPSAGIAEIEQT